MSARLEEIKKRLYDQEKSRDLTPLGSRITENDIQWLVAQAELAQALETDLTSFRLMLRRNTNMRKDMRRR